MKCLGLIMSTKQEKEFLSLCYTGDVKSEKTLLAKDPSLINSKYDDGKLNQII